jgi:hypothetical protein
MKTRKLFWLVPMLAALALPAYAGNRDHGTARFEQRIERQGDRIRHGIRNGDLTRHEAKVLRKQQRHITKLQQRFERDGQLDRHERRMLERKLDGASKRIARLKHNDRHRDNGHHRHGDHGRYSFQPHRSGYPYAPRYPAKHMPRHDYSDHRPHGSVVLSFFDIW